MLKRCRLVLALLVVPFVTCLQAADKPPLPVCNRVRFECTAANKGDFVGAILEGSNQSRTEGYVTLGEVKTAPELAAGAGWGELTLDNARLYRWLRFRLQSPGAKKVGKIELFTGERMLAGDGKGAQFRVFGADGVQSERAIGYDLFDSAVAQRTGFKPDATSLDGPADVTIQSNKDAVIRYTLDGSWPSAEHGETYTAPIHIDKNTTISAVAILPERAPSLLMTTTYLVKGMTKPGLNSAHLGNSLTGTTGGFFRYARTAGYDHKSAAFLRPGALTRELWALVSGTYKDDKLASAKEAQAQKRGIPAWADYWAKIGKVDLLTLQPRDFNLDKELEAEISFIKLFREKSPDLQPWLYCEWVEQKRDRPSDRGEVPSYQMKKTFPALTWEESMGAMLLYMEELQHRLGQQYTEGKRARIIPAALAMGWIKNKIDHGQFGGAKPGSFYPMLFNDQVHPADAPIHGTANGAYLVDMTWYSAFYREAPEGKVLPIETTFTPEQARIVERLAWDVIQNYPDCGLYEVGTQPCGKPEFSSDGKSITLKSSTPGAWFRYTLDGTTPTRTCGYVYCGVISVQPGIQVKAVAYKSGMADSDISEMPAAEAPPKKAAATGPLAPVLQSFVDQHLVAGVVALVASKDKVLDVESAGFSSLATKEPMRDDDLFWIASMSKSLTGTALMMLVDEGKLSLDDPVEKYLPEFKGQMVAARDEKSTPHPPQHPITVREIMSHTSGLVLASDKELKRAYTLQENVAEYAQKPLRQEPGTKYEYNNCGINTGGRLIEVLSGMPYAEFMQKRLFNPLGMKDTTFWPSEEQAKRLAHSARFNADKTGLEEVKLDQNVTPAAIAKFSEGVPVPAAIIGEMGFGISFSYGKHYGEPAGGYFSTAHDIGILCQMLLNGGEFGGKRHLSEKALQQMTSNQNGSAAVSPSEGYGVGWSTKLRDDEGPSPGSFGHRGARRTVMWVDPKNGLAMVLLVERFDMTGNEQKSLYGPFFRAAIEKFGGGR